MRMIGKGLAMAGIALAACNLPAMASAKDGVDAWSRGDYSGAVRQWQGEAAAGDPDAEFNLAHAYLTGKGVAKDSGKAEALYRQAAEQGHMRAIDAYGLLLFGLGRRQEAMPWIEAAARQGEPRAQYVLGTATFNGDLAPKDWVRAYALMSRAAAAGMPQARQSLTKMDEVIPLDQRQKGIALAGQLDAQARQVRESELAAADLGARKLGSGPASTSLPHRMATTQVPPSSAATTGLTSDAAADAPRAVSAGADYANAVEPSSREQRAGNAVRIHSGAVPPAAATSEPSMRPASAPAARGATGPWRIQLGAFGDRDNADTMWARVRNRLELAGKIRFNEAAGKITRLQAGGFASEEDAARACARLKAVNLACVIVRP